MRSSFRPLALALLAGACHQDHSSDSVPLPSTGTSNLGLTLENVLGSGSLRLVEVSEARQGEDLNGDGDRFDRIAHVVDLEARRLVNTGLAPGFPNSSSDPLPVVSIGETLAFAVSEFESGNLDRNGDGDALDRVLALYERDTGLVTNLGVAASTVLASTDVVAFDVPEAAEGEDLDGDGDQDDSVPAVHDRRTGETWSTGLAGARVTNVAGDFVALRVDESVVGDRNSDGDALDVVFEAYDVNAREVQNPGLAQARIFNPELGPAAYRGRFAVLVSEEDQGATDLDGDGDALDFVTFLYEPATRIGRNLGRRIVRSTGLDSLVLADFPEPGTPFVSQIVWLYDPDADAFTSTGLRGSVEVLHSAQVRPSQLVVIVEEEFQGEDLDANGFLDSSVAVIFDVASGRTQNLAVDGFVQPFRGGLLVHSRESRARRDWNGDGDQDDVPVIFTWSERDRRVVNTRQAPVFAVPLGEELALMLVEESGTDRNGDGDGLDRVVETYDAFTRAITNLGLATFFLFESASDKALVPVFESEQGADLNGDGDQDDRVLHLTEVLFYARQADG